MSELGPGPGGAQDRPSVARIYDFFLGGSHNVAPDRVRAQEIMSAWPNVVPATWANRSFLRHAVEHALSSGVHQFIDLGSGVPTKGNVHEIASRHDPAARVAYVDNDPIAVADSTIMLEDVPTATITDADLTDPAAVLAAPGVADLIDFSSPIALLAITALHFVDDDERAAAILSGYRARMVPGSLLAITHSSSDYPDDPEFSREHREAIRLYASSSNPVRPRSRAEIRALLAAGGFAPNADDLVAIERWAPSGHDGGPLGVYAVITQQLRET